MRTTFAVIHLSHLAHNVRVIKNILPPNTKMTAVVKADGYGHGSIPISRKVLQAGVDSLAVAIAEEGARLREAGITAPIHVLGVTLPESVDLLVAHDLIATVFTEEQLDQLSAAARSAGKQASMMLKMDTGMGRIGFKPEELTSFVKKAATYRELNICGLFTHFASADAADKSYALEQKERLDQALSDLEKAGFILPCISAANSAAIIDLKASYQTVRPGIILYGLPPSQEMQHHLPLKPVMELKTKIVYIKKVPVQASVGYGCTYHASQETYIATLPIGYADGYSRLLSNKASVLIGGKRCPVVGNVCMDQIMVDLGPTCQAKVGDEAVLFGRQGDEEISVDELAELIGTISYEILCGISPRVPRLYVE